MPADRPDTAALALALRSQRHRAGLTLRQLADRANYSLATLSSAASGKSLPRWEVVDAYAKGCEATSDALTHLRHLWQQANAENTAAEKPPVTAPSTPPDPPTKRTTSRRSLRRLGRTEPALPTTPTPHTDPPRTNHTGAPTTHRPPTARRNRKPAPHPTFADTVTSTETGTGSTPRPPRQRTFPSDPGNSVPALMRHARATDPALPTDQTNPLATALSLCTRPEHFTELMNLLWQRSGLSLRDLSQHSKKAHHPIPKSTFHAALNSNQLPRTEVLHALLHACGSPSEHWPLWHHTRTRLKLALLVDQEEPMSKIMILRTDPVRTVALTYLAVLILVVSQLIFILTLLPD